LNSDAIWLGPNPLGLLSAAWVPARMEALLLLLDPARAVGHQGSGDFLLGADGRLSRGAGLVYSGAQILRTDSLAHIKEQVFSLNIVWDQMARRGGLFGISYPGQWCDVGRPESIPLAEALLHSAPLS
jgi:N-acetyl-alpha-D-muramate 1-phosphate uridylyltransferase